MPRPRKCRLIDGVPAARLFKPQGIPARQLEEVYLSLEGFEALRLADLEGLRQEQAAARMGVSRQTFGRLLAEARRAVAEAVVKGICLRIEGDPGAAAPPYARRRGNADAVLEPQTIPGKGSDGMKERIAVSSEGRDLDSRVDPRFGRAAGFLLVDPETLSAEYLDNGGARAMGQGAGIQAAEMLVRHGVTVVLTGYVGPKAFQALSAAGIRVGQNLEDCTVREAVERYREGRVTLAGGPNRPAGGGRP